MKKPVIITVSVLLMAFGAAGIPVLDSIDSDSPFKDLEKSNSPIEAGALDLSVDFKTVEKDGDISAGDWNYQTETFDEKNITRNSSGKTLLDINLDSNPAWIWLKVNQTANIEGSNHLDKEISPEVLGYWSMDGNSKKIKDEKGNDGINFGAERNSSGKFGKALKFDGHDDYVEVPHRSSYETGEGTVSVWFKMNDTSENWIFTKDENGCEEDCGHVSMAYDSFIADDNLGVRVQNDGNGIYYKLVANKSKKKIEPGEWHHAAFTFGKYGMKLYVDGELHDTNTNTEGIIQNELPIKMGTKYDKDSYFNGKLDEPRFYGESLTQNEIQQLYNDNQITSPDNTEQFKECEVNIKSVEAGDEPVDARGNTDLMVEVENTGRKEEVRVLLDSDDSQGETEVREIGRNQSEEFDFSMTAADDRDMDGEILMNVTAGENCKSGDSEEKSFPVDYSGDPAVARVEKTPEVPKAGEEVEFKVATQKDIQDQKWKFFQNPDSEDEWWKNDQDVEISKKKTVTRTYDNPGYYPFTLRIKRNDGSSHVYSAHVRVRPETREPACPDDTPDEGELGEHLRFQVWYDNGNGDFEPANEELIFNGTAHMFGNFESYSGPGLQQGGLLDGNFRNSSDFDPQPFQPGTHHLGIKWYLPQNAPCQVEGDKKKFDFSLSAQQSRHNPFPGTSYEGKGFNDIEKSVENHFEAAKLGKENPQEEPPENVCGPVLGPEGKVKIERTVNSQTEQHQYNAEIDPQQKENTLRYEYQGGGDQLGETRDIESEVFTVEVNGEPGEVVYIKTKSGQIIGTAVLNGEGDVTSGTSGQYTFELLEVNDQSDSTEYKIKVTTNGEEGSGVRELSHIDFSFCEPIEKEANWQLDLTTNQLHVPQQSEGDNDLVLTALNETDDGSFLNPDVKRSEEDFELVDDQFKFENGKAYVRFRVEEGEKEVGLTSYELPGPYSGWKDPEANEQILHDYSFRKYGEGEHRIEVDLPGGSDYPAPEELKEKRTRDVENQLVFEKKGEYGFSGDDLKNFSHEKDLELQNGTLSFSFKMDDKSSNWMFSKDRDSCKNDCGHLSVAYNSFISDGFGVRLQNNGGGENDVILEPRKKVEDHRTYNVTVSWGDQGARLYLDGKLHAIDNSTKGISNNKLPLILGNRYDGESGKGMDGTISNLEIYGNQLTSEQIEKINGGISQ